MADNQNLFDVADPNDPNDPRNQQINRGPVQPGGAYAAQAPAAGAAGAAGAVAKAGDLLGARGDRDAGFAYAKAAEAAGAPAAPAPAAAAPPAAAPAAAAPAPVSDPADPFAAMGGGVKLPGGEWVPKDHPLAATAGATAGAPGGAASGAASAPGSTGAVGKTPAEIAASASTVSSTPGAAPTEATANQGTQDVVRNSWLAKATQGTTIDPNDPNIRAQVDPFAAAQERKRREYESEAAERLSAQGLGDSGQMEQERRFGAERAGQATGMFKSQLIGQELKTRRDEIADALSNLGNTISNDQKNALTRDLADIDAAIKREGIKSGHDVGMAEIGVKDKLGTGGLNNDLMRMMLQNQQFGDAQALDWSKFDWDTNPTNPDNF